MPELFRLVAWRRGVDDLPEMAGQADWLWPSSGPPSVSGFDNPASDIVHRVEIHHAEGTNRPLLLVAFDFVGNAHIRLNGDIVEWREGAVRCFLKGEAEDGDLGYQEVLFVEGTFGSIFDSNNAAIDIGFQRLNMRWLSNGLWIERRNIRVRRTADCPQDLRDERWGFRNAAKKPVVLGAMGIAGWRKRDFDGSVRFSARDNTLVTPFLFECSAHLEEDNIVGPRRWAIEPLCARGQRASLPELLLVQRQDESSLEEWITGGRRSFNPIGWNLSCQGIAGDMIWGSPESTLENWNRAVTEPYLAALRTAQDGRPVSLVPRWRETVLDAGELPPLQLQWSVIDAAPQKRNLQRTDFVPFRQYDSREACPLDETLGLVNTTLSWADGKTHAATSVQFPAFLNHQGQAHIRKVRITCISRELPLDGRATSGRWSDGALVIKFLEVRPGTGQNDALRIGALDLHLVCCGTDALDNYPGRVAALLREAPDPYPGAVTPLASVGINVTWPVARVLPGGQDSLPGEAFAPSGNRMADLAQPVRGTAGDSVEGRRREARFCREQPVVFAPQSSGLRGTSLQLFKLRAIETADAAYSQTLQFNLLGADQGGLRLPKEVDQVWPRQIVVLDRQPFLLARLELPEATSQVQNDRECGVWLGSQAEGPSWRLAGFSEGFVLRLPPQGVGEAVERRPANGGPNDIVEGEVLDFRLTPPARLQLRTSDEDRNLTEAPWNLRRILHYTGGPFDGALLDFLEFEMLYALSCQVERPNLRLVELASRMGQIQGRLNESPPWKSLRAVEASYRSHLEAWSLVYRQYLSRLAVLEPWDTQQSGPLVLTDGLRYYLRQSARLRYSPSLPSAKGQHPVNPAERPKEHLANKPPHYSDGLAGGAAWGFESEASYAALWREPVANAGLLVAPYLSALGGWSVQKAWFDNRRASIEADVAQGRVHYYATERIGRISCLWNRAKLVSIYERRVVRPIDRPNPSDPDAQPLWQDEHHGRAIIRLVAKYVQILQKERRYPDFGGPAVERGFVQACRFESEIIDVYNIAEQDVIVDGVRYGFKVRLPGLSGREARKPRIGLELAVDPRKGHATEHVLVASPENLFFYSDTRPEYDDNTDQWLAVPTVDGPRSVSLDLNPPPGFVAIKAQKPDDFQTDTEPPILSAFSDFTFLLSEAAGQVDLMAQRADQALSAVIENLTLVRDPAAAGRNAAMKLLRAYGAPPNVPGLTFNRDKLGYYFSGPGRLNHVEITPSAGLVNRAKELTKQLQPMSIRVPTTSLADRVVPDFNLADFGELSQLLPDFAGLKLEALFSGVKMPKLGSDRVRVTQGIEPQSQRAWLQVDIDLPLGKRASVFSLGPIELSVDQARLRATVRMEVDASGCVTRQSCGRISADWQLYVGGLDLLVFADTVLSFDNDGRLKFALRPEKIRLSGVLTFLTDLMKTLSSSDSGFMLEPIEQRGAVVGVRTILDLPLPDTQFGAFGISGLRLGSLFEVQASASAEGALDFALGLGLTLGRKTAPFTLTVFILGGGGWLEVRASYRPLSGRTRTTITIGAVAGACLAIALGPVRGGVWIQFGVAGEFESGGGQADTLTIIVLFLVRGEAEVLGLVSVSLYLLLEAEYNRQSGALVGRGTLSIRVKICMFFTLKFEASVEYRFVKGSSGCRGLASAPVNIEKATRDYVWLLN